MKSSEIKDRFDAVSSKYDGERRQLIPCFEDFYSTIIDLIPAENSAPKVLDVGAGTGLLSALVLERFPQAKITLIDISEGMLDKAQERLGAGHRYIVADYAKHTFDETYDIVVSSLSIHHLNDEAKENLYERIGKILAIGGVFINGDQFLGATDKLEKVNQRWWSNAVEDSGLDEQSIAAWRERVAMDLPASVSDNLKWLESAGFTNVDCIYKMYNFGIIYGEKK